MQKLLLCAAFGILTAGVALALPELNKVAPLSQSEAALSRCEVHGTRLQLAKVRIRYGRMGAPMAYTVSKRLFPHARTVLFGGCIVSKDSPSHRQIKFCSECRAAEKRWLVAHKK